MIFSILKMIPMVFSRIIFAITNPTNPPRILTNKKGVCKSIVGFCQTITLYNSRATQMACGINNNTLKRWYIGSFFPKTKKYLLLNGNFKNS
jgi:hypothetical protein|tara:strand:+ start:665 stop:940 length:276 start_codon:yes stop_codon:yes gene_type:complete